MDTTFSFNRIGLLLQRFFIERKRSEINYRIIVVVMFAMFGLTRDFGHGTMKFLLFLLGGFYAVGVTREIHSPTSGKSYFMIPATQAEKYFVTLFINLIYFFIGMMICYFIGNILSVLLNNLLHTTTGIFELRPIGWPIFQNNGHGFSGSFFNNIYLNFISVQSIFILGAIYFSKSTYVKTVLMYSGIIAAIFVIFLTIMVPTFIEAPGDNVKNILQDFPFMPIASVVVKVLCYFLLYVGYVRLKEKEV